MISKCNLKGALFLLVLLLAGCATMGKYWTLMSVPEEAGQVFTKITNQEDLLDTTGSFAISKDGTKVAFTSWKTGNGDIYVKDLTGGKAILQRTSRGETEYGPCFSPDGKFLAYHALRDGHWNIYLIGAETGAAIRQITTGSPPDAVWPQFSPDGKELAFQSLEYAFDKFGKSYLKGGSIWVFEIETGKLSQYTEGFLPKFTPDGRSIVFKRPSKVGEGWHGLWKVDLETGAEVNILSGEDFGIGEFDISPDGKKIVFSTDKGTRKSSTGIVNSNIWVIDIDGTNLTQLTFHPSDDRWPCWSPDMRSIYFLSCRSEEKKGVMNIWQLSYQPLK